MSSLVAKKIDVATYQNFLAASNHSAFHRMEWVQLLVRCFKLKLVLVGFFSGDRLVAVSPVVGRRLGLIPIWGAPLRKIGTPAATPLCSPAEYCAEAGHALRIWARANNVAYLQATVPANIPVEGLHINRKEILYNLELDLTPPLEELWSTLAQQKSCVRAALRNGVRLHWKRGRALLDSLSPMLRDTYEKQGIEPNHPLRLYEEILERQNELGIGLLCATHQGQVISMIWTLHDSNTCYYWDAVSLNRARDVKANHLLVWCLIRWAKNRGLKTLDFVGGGIGREGNRPGIGRFKQSMGAKPKTYNVFYWYNPLLGIALDIYRLLQRVKMSRSRNPTINEPAQR